MRDETLPKRLAVIKSFPNYLKSFLWTKTPHEWDRDEKFRAEQILHEALDIIKKQNDLSALQARMAGAFEEICKALTAIEAQYVYKGYWTADAPILIKNTYGFLEEAAAGLTKKMPEREDSAKEPPPSNGKLPNGNKKHD